LKNGRNKYEENTMMSKVIGSGSDVLICTSLVGKTRESLLGELNAVIAREPDVIEWRGDFFAGVATSEDVLETARQISAAASNTAMIFTIRSALEGGQKISLSDRQVIELNAMVCKNTSIEYVDCELRMPHEQIDYLRSVANESGTKIIGSFHDFHGTPDAELMLKKIEEAELAHLDVAKIAVMPHCLEDVLVLLEVTLKAKQTCSIPLVTVSMGTYGAVSRMIGGIFGSSLTFAVGEERSAPGQIPIEDMRCVLNIIKKLR
jgi:3-dehydroquinate dehydratase-1